MAASRDATQGAPARLIALDWGTTSLRGWLLGDGAAVLDRRASPSGVMAVGGGDFGAVYRSFTAAWRAALPDLPALASGMVGSRQGWVEAPYAACPAGLADLAGRGVMAGEAGAALRIVPGLSWRAPDGITDVMRGEETQIVGALDDGGGDGLFVLPGTHSKWARVEGGRIVGFATYMTGELFAVLRGHSILGRMMPADGTMAHDSRAFADGVADGLNHGHDLSRRLFGVRTRGLFGELGAPAAPSFLSGLLIGTELAGARASGQVGAGATGVTLIGEATLCARYAEALAAAGIAARIADADVTPRGLWRLARAAGMIDA